MEDYILKEIDKIGQMLFHIATKLGLFDSHSPDYTLADVKREFNDGNLPFNLDTVLQLDNPVLYLVEDVKLSDVAIETLVEIIFHSDLCEDKKNALLKDALTYLDSKGNFSFRLHSLLNYH